MIKFRKTRDKNHQRTCGQFIFKARSPTQTMNALDEYLRSLGDEPVRWLAREVRSWGNEFSYNELAAAIEAGNLDDLIDWQERYAKVVNEKLAPMWAAAIAEASKKATRGMTVLSDSNDYVRGWINTHGGELITRLSDESRLAVMNVILRGQGLRMAPRDVAKEVRPLIGLTDRQAAANQKYREKIFNRYRESGMSEAKAAKRADKAALKYAGKQHRYRAETIVLTENAYAYNRGAHMSVIQSIADGYMGRCAMIWTTAGTNRVCSRCLALKDTVVGYTDELGVLLPPLHPRCRCAIMYDENLGRDKKPNVGSLNRHFAKPLTEKDIAAIKSEEDTAYNTKTGEDFGFKKMKTAPDWTREILFTNPPDKVYGHTLNCQRCVVAHEARMRGYDVIARPSWGIEDSLRNSGDWLNAFDYSSKDFKECIGKTGDEVIKSAKEIMRSFGEGARAIIFFKWDKTLVSNAFGHVIVAQCRENGVVNFGDPQWGKRSVAHKLKSADFAEKIILLRIDNLKFTNIVKRCCKNKE